MTSTSHLGAATTTSKRSHGVATADRLIEFALREIHSAGHDSFNIDRVLRDSGVSRSSLYHHFGNRAGLIAAATIDEFKKMGEADNRNFRIVASTVSTSTELVEAIRQLVISSTTPERRIFRQKQIRAYYLCQNDLTLSQAIQDLTNSQLRMFTESLQMLELRGVIALHIPAPTISRWVIAQFFSQSILDLLDDDKEFTSQWIQLTIEAICRILGISHSSM